MPDSLYASDLHPSLTQGDILENVSVEEPHIRSGERALTVMVLTHSCEIDKRNNAAMLVAQVRELREFSPNVYDAIRAHKQLSLFYLPPEDSYPIERCVDFRITLRVGFGAVGATGFSRFAEEDHRVFPGADPRIQSLSDFGLAALHGRIVAFYTRSRDFESIIPRQA